MRACVRARTRVDRCLSSWNWTCPKISSHRCPQTFSSSSALSRYGSSRCGQAVVTLWSTVHSRCPWTYSQGALAVPGQTVVKLWAYDSQREVKIAHLLSRVALAVIAMVEQMFSGGALSSHARSLSNNFLYLPHTLISLALDSKALQQSRNGPPECPV